MLRMDDILSQHILKLLPPPSTRSLQVHDCGTVVEACAKFVYDAGDFHALTQLGKYLYAADARVTRRPTWVIVLSTRTEPLAC